MCCVLTVLHPHSVKISLFFFLLQERYAEISLYKVLRLLCAQTTCYLASMLCPQATVYLPACTKAEVQPL